MQIIFTLVNIWIYFGIAQAAVIDEKLLIGNGLDEGERNYLITRSTLNFDIRFSLYYSWNITIIWINFATNTRWHT